MTINISMIEQSILDYITRRDYVSFAALNRISLNPEIKKEIDEETYSFVGSETIPNLIYGVQKTSIIEGVFKLLRAGKIHLERTTPLLYFIDGEAPNMPLAKRPPKNGYKEPHWVPCALRPGPKPGLSD